MVHAYHAIFTAYGFWLPNDPRGSWTDFVASWEILRYGRPIAANSRASVALKPHDHKLRVAAKSALKFPPVLFSGVDARAIGKGFDTAIDASKYKVLACAIMPDHVRAVVGRHKQDIERIVGHLKGRASTELERTGLHPFLGHRAADGSLPSPWAEKCWKVFLNTAADIERAIGYVNRNPGREGLPPQNWYFLAHNRPERGV